MRRAVAITLGALLGAAWAASAQPGFDTVQIRTTPIADGVYMLQGAGGNMGLSVGDDGAFLIDDQFAPLTDKIKAAIGEVTDAPVRFVLNTHWHGDHVGGNEHLGQAGAMIVAHQNVRKRLNPEEFGEVMGRTQQAPPAALPIVTFSDQVDLYWNGQKIHVFHVPHAHTDGDAIVYFTAANVFHMGDTFFNGRYPFIDTNSGGGINGVIHAANAVLAVANSASRLIPGHGALGTVDDLRAYRDMLVTVRDRIRLMINDGKSEDEVVAAHPTADLDDTWGAQPERFVRGVYQSLSR